MRRSVVLRAAVVAALLLVLAACAASGNDVASAGSAHVVGFWYGLWHGLISPITFLISLFSDHVNIYAVHNNGNWYNFGFMLGVSTVFSGTGRSAAAGRRSGGSGSRPRRARSGS